MINLDTIFIKQLSIDAVIGVYEFEQQAVQPLNLDLEMYIQRENFAQAAENSLLEETIDYDKICQLIVELVAKKSYKLLETLAEDVVSLLLSNERIQGCQLSIDKPHAVALADTVGVKIVRYRN